MQLKDCYQKVKIKKMIELMNDELGGKIMTEFVGIRPKTYYLLISDGSGDKKVKGIKKCITEKRLKFENCFQNLLTKDVYRIIKLH